MSDLKAVLDGVASAVAADPVRGVVRIAADCRLGGAHQTDVRLDGHRLTSDQPPMLGGDGAGPNPVQLALAALGACQAQTYRFWAAKLGLPLDEVTVEVRGDVDVHGIFGLRPDARPGFGTVGLTVRLHGPDAPERYEDLRRAVEAHCPVLDVFTRPVPVTTAVSAHAPDADRRKP